MELPKTQLLRSCGAYRCEPKRGMSLAEVSVLLKNAAVNLRAVGRVLSRKGTIDRDLLLDFSSGANDLRRLADEVSRIDGDQHLIRMDQADRVTPCVCPAKGFCDRHSVDKTEYWHTLCRTKREMYKLWEDGRGPGQLPDLVSSND